MKCEEPANRMTEFAQSFPSMRGAPGIKPWKPEELNRWAAGTPRWRLPALPDRAPTRPDGPC